MTRCKITVPLFKDLLYCTCILEFSFFIENISCGIILLKYKLVLETLYLSKRKFLEPIFISKQFVLEFFGLSKRLILQSIYLSERNIVLKYFCLFTRFILAKCSQSETMVKWLTLIEQASMSNHLAL